MSYNKQMVVGSSWKIYFKSIQKAKDYVYKLGESIDFTDPNLLEIYTLPDFISLGVISTLERNPKIKIGAQDMFWEDYGAFTGEVSPLMLKNIGCKYIYIGHSERRKYFGENNHTINRKVVASYRNGLIPILLVGETIEEYEKGQRDKALKEQLSISPERHTW
ncbi:MAG: triose-phosphate isomerase [Actinomycetota bacterium]|nr:triose-phosphate isomerase [Actinomycetota bacterium]